MESTVTACITTYKRPASLARLVRSIEQFYPRLTILVQHTGGNLSWGRNRLADACRTEFFLLLEDDFELTAATKLGCLLDIVRSSDELAGAGALLMKNGRQQFWCHDFEVIRDRVEMWPAKKPWRFSPAGHPYRVCHALSNFGIFRTAALREIRWDENLPLTEHKDFFFRLWQTRRWRVAFTPDCMAIHHADRPADYLPMRRRNFGERVEAKHGLRFVGPRFSNRQSIPNIVVLGVGHANTSITCRQLGALGWNLGDADEQYAESVSCREINRPAFGGGPLNKAAAAAAVKKLPVPWVIKLPGFVKTLDRWREVLAPYQPLLLWVTKDSERVSQSYVTRGKSPGQAAKIVADREANAARQFEIWPWAKLKVDAAQVRAAVELFDLTR